MKKSVLFGLSFVLALLLGAIDDVMSEELHYFAVSILGGKPLPPVTDWIFDVFAIWSNGSITCIFLIPWSLLLLYDLLTPRQLSDLEASIRLFYGFICFGVSEAILFVFFAASSLMPFLPIWKGMAPEAPLSAYVPHFLLLFVIVGIVVTAVRNAVRRAQERKKPEPGE